MNKFIRILLFVILILVPIIFYKSFYRPKQKKAIPKPVIVRQVLAAKPKIALIFDDLGESLKDFEAIYSLHIPLTISILPGLEFSKNIANIGYRCGFSVLIHLPLEPKEGKKYATTKYKIISASLSKPEIDYILRTYLSYIRFAVGANNHMGSSATENINLMRQVMHALKERNLIFVDSQTSLKSKACEAARFEGVICAKNSGFIDTVDNQIVIEKRFTKLAKKAKKKRKMIIIVHPKKNTIAALRNVLPQWQKEVEFITVKEYFSL
jgi:polysaccharide deacetylase 2 family uncharacterized protein YibQ